MTATDVVCPVCGSSRAEIIDERQRVPLFQNRLYATAAEAQAAEIGELSMVRCSQCTFVWNRSYDAGRLRYDGQYENDQTSSAMFREHLKDVADRILAAAPVGEPIHILEVGCGQGGFLAVLAERAGRALGSAVGFDPAWRGADGEGPGSIRVWKSYFGVESRSRLAQEPNLVLSRHTIEHVPQPRPFLSAIRNALPQGSCARLFVETPDVNWILRHVAVHDFFYEHCSLFTRQAMAQCLTRASFEVRAIDAVFGGQYQLAEAQASEVQLTRFTPSTNIFDEPNDGTRYTSGRSAYLAGWRGRLARARGSGAVAIWGAGAKGATFALLVSEHATSIDCVIDIKPNKQGHFIPLTGQPIVSPETARDLGVRTVLIMNPNYVDEIVALSRAIGFDADFIPVD